MAARVDIEMMDGSDGAEKHAVARNQGAVAIRSLTTTRTQVFYLKVGAEFHHDEVTEIVNVTLSSPKDFSCQPCVKNPYGPPYDGGNYQGVLMITFQPLQLLARPRQHVAVERACSLQVHLRHAKGP